ncbi:unnamed protein product [Didymodactylos carnosus]|uniref:Uncharacterized protein n=1 Tax=Didymodactylos carnosus TaxID=1234261 RepID=A0A816A3G8_9BILA|nr:unnamed protein product [Didymodactylos carnosus]CAF1590601.1 unnamed protein product [Didymodactylos carnosus]CAF3573427.1 unnamed protein product [Didymodactylos carnosus]CAF4462401.1 unnamed protein product [Didymodactylos carnosus]
MRTLFRAGDSQLLRNISNWLAGVAGDCSRPAELDKFSKRKLIIQLKNLNIIVASSFLKQQLIELILLNESDENDTSYSAQETSKLSETTVAALRSSQHTKIREQ